MRITIDFNASTPLYLQIREQIILAIAQGHLEAGEALPTVRQLAEALAINPMTVNKAYQLLKQEQFIVTNRSEGTKVAESLPHNIDADYWDRFKILIAEGLMRSSGKNAFWLELEKQINLLKENP